MMGMAVPQRASQSYGYLALAQQQQQAAQERIRSARQALNDAKTNEAKDAARAQLRQLLADVFDQDMQMRETQAAEIESRLAKLRQQYQARAKVKEEIIDLQLKVIEQDAAGLGFPGGQSFVPTPQSPVDSASPFENRSNFPAPAIPRDPMAGGRGRYSPPATRVDQFDPVPRERTLEEVNKISPSVVAKLKERGQFVESAEGKLYAYANVQLPSGPSVIRVIDSATGKLVGTATVNTVVGPLQFTDEGIASREANGNLELRIPLKRRTGRNADVFEPGASAASTIRPFPSYADLTSEYKALRDQYRQATFGLATAEAEFNESVRAAQQTQPKTTVEEVKKQQPDAWQAVKHFRLEVEAAHRLLETKLDLLELDRIAATRTRDAAKTDLDPWSVTRGNEQGS
jgi:hypothetical protein